MYPFKRKINSDLEYDSILLFYRDENGIKRTKFISRAEVPFYILKDRESQEALTPPMFIEKDKVEKITTYSDTLYREIALRTDSMSYYDRIMDERSSNMKNLLKHNLIYNADMDVADRYIKNFMEEYEPDMKYKLHKCYYDIEVDQMPNGFRDKGFVGFPDEDSAPCPINIITLFDGKNMNAYVFNFRNPLNTLQADFERRLEEKLEIVKKTIFEEDGIILNNIYTSFYNSEEETIEAFFRTVHTVDPDIMLAWNAGFDCKTLMNRLTKLYNKKKELREQGIRGYDQMLTVVCDQKCTIMKDDIGRDVYITPKAYYKQNKDKPFVDRIDTFTILDGIHWDDQLVVIKHY